MTEVDLLKSLNWRYAVKKFDPTRKLKESEWQAIEQSLVLSPSSYGLQPWKFLVVQDPLLRKKLREVSWGQPQVEDCSHYVVFLAKNQMTERDVDAYVDRIIEVRGTPREQLSKMKEIIVNDVVHGPRSAWIKDWAARQCYIALGQAMTCAATLGIDTCPLEGLDPEKYDEILGLSSSGHFTLCALAIGFRHPDDWLGKLQKVRFPVSQMVEFR